MLHFFIKELSDFIVSHPLPTGVKVRVLAHTGEQSHYNVSLEVTPDGATPILLGLDTKLYFQTPKAPAWALVPNEAFIQGAPKSVAITALTPKLAKVVVPKGAYKNDTHHTTSEFLYGAILEACLELTVISLWSRMAGRNSIIGGGDTQPCGIAVVAQCRRPQPRMVLTPSLTLHAYTPSEAYNTLQSKITYFPTLEYLGRQAGKLRTKSAEDLAHRTGLAHRLYSKLQALLVDRPDLPVQLHGFEDSPILSLTINAPGLPAVILHAGINPSGVACRPQVDLPSAATLFKAPQIDITPSMARVCLFIHEAWAAVQAEPRSPTCDTTPQALDSPLQLV